MKAERISALNPCTWELRNITIDGNVVPHAFFRIIRHKTQSGKIKTDYLAINIMADMLFWYRPVFDPENKIYRHKFGGDKLQRSYGDWALQFGTSKRAVKDSCALLRKLDLATFEFRDIVAKGRTINNVMYCEPILSSLQNLIANGDLNAQSACKTRNCHPSPEKNEGGGTKKWNTNTHTSTEISNNTSAVVDPEEKEYHPDRVVPLLIKEAIMAANQLIGQFQTGRLYHAAWVLQWQFLEENYPIAKTWNKVITGMIEKGLNHPPKCPTPSEVIQKRLREERRRISHLAHETVKVNQERELELRFNALPEEEKNEWHHMARHQIGNRNAEIIDSYAFNLWKKGITTSRVESIYQKPDDAERVSVCKEINKLVSSLATSLSI